MDKLKFMRPIVLALLFVPGCTRGPISEPVSQSPSTQEHSEPSAVMQAPLLSRKLTKGESLYIRYCADCHGWEGGGGGPAVALLDVKPPVLRNSELFAEYSENDFFDKVLHGRALPVPLADYIESESTPEVNALLSHIRRLPTLSWDEVNAGQDIYDGLCVNCHGLYGRGDGVWASKMSVPLPDLSNSKVQDKHSDAKLLQIIAEGTGAMPGAGDVLSLDEIQSVVSFVRIFSPGFAGYDRFCAVCHGLDGHPVELFFVDEEGLGFNRTDLPVFDANYFQTHSDEQLRPRVLHMLDRSRTTMPHFAGELKADEVRQILMYLRDPIPDS